MIKTEDGVNWQYFDYLSNKIDRYCKGFFGSQSEKANENSKNQIKHKENK